MRSMSLRLLFGCCVAALLCLAALPVLAAGPAVARWQVVLVAGDNAQPVFDNAINWLSGWLASRGVAPADIHRLSAHPREPGVEAATSARVLQRVASLN